VFSWLSLVITTNLITSRSSGIAAINFETRTRNKSSFRTGEIRDYASYLVTLPVATEGNHLDHDCGNVSICGIRIGVDRDWGATFRTADRLLRDIPTI
jgi:hypothetical protein